MSDYSRVHDFSAKDGLTTGDPNKLIKGSEVDAELDAAVTAIATKYDSNDLASQAEAEGETLNSVLMTPLRLANWADANGGMAGDIQALTDPGADTILGWDDTASAAINFTIGTGLAATATTIATDDANIDHDALNNFVADEHVAHSSITLTAGTGLSGGGTIDANRSFSLSHLAIESLSDPGADRILFWDDGATATGWLTVSTGLSLTTTNLTTDDANIDHDALSNFVADEHVAHASVTMTAGTGLSGGGTIAATRTFNLDVDSLTNNIGATGAVDLDVDEVAIANSTATEKVHAAALITPEVPTTVSGTTDTLAETDFGKVIRYSSTSTVTITLPNGLKTGFWAVLQKTGATGTVTLSATTTLNTENSFTDITAQYGSVTVLHLGSNVWTAWGSLV